MKKLRGFIFATMLLASTTSVFAATCSPHSYSTSSSSSTQYLYSHPVTYYVQDASGNLIKKTKYCAKSAVIYKYKTSCDNCGNVSKQWEETGSIRHSFCD